MEQYDLYRDMKQRTGGEIYIGVVGPVRTGKSTFIKRFMQEIVLPQMKDEADRVRATDELPQSAQGRTIMTTEPKFIPKNAAKLLCPDQTEIKVRLVDCVGYMVDGASGHMENNQERKVRTPWSEEEIPFTQAAEIGTTKVIRDHATVGVIISSDGSFGELNRPVFEKPEERTVNELKTLGKPFILLLNSTHPEADSTTALVQKLTERYTIPVLPVNCLKLNRADFHKLLEELLSAFPIREIKFHLPVWAEYCEFGNELRKEAIRIATETMTNKKTMKDIRTSETESESAVFLPIEAPKVHRNTGEIEYELKPQKEAYKKGMLELCGCEIESEHAFYRQIREISKKKQEYARFSEACSQVEEKGYGVVLPATEQLRLSDPELIRSGGKYGVKLRATAPSLHLIKANIITEIAPIVGSEEQAQDLITYLNHQKELGEDGLRTASIFGKSVMCLVEEGVQTKMEVVNEECQKKLQESIEKIINESTGGVICFII